MLIYVGGECGPDPKPDRSRTKPDFGRNKLDLRSEPTLGWINIQAPSGYRH